MLRKLFLLSFILIIPISIATFVPKKRKQSNMFEQKIYCGGCFFANNMDNRLGNPFDIHREYGSEPVSASTQQLVNIIQHEMHIPHIAIRARKMNDNAVKTMGYHNSFVIMDNGQWYLYISEDWFRALSREEQRFILGHEMAHIIYQHCQKKGLIGEGIKLAQESGNNYLNISVGDNEVQHIQAQGLAGSAYQLKMTAERNFEIEADKLAIDRLKCYQGARALMQRFYNNFVDKGTETHPSWRERYLVMQNNYSSGPNALKL